MGHKHVFSKLTAEEAAADMICMFRHCMRRPVVVVCRECREWRCEGHAGTKPKRDEWMAGFSVALAEIHRQLLGGNDSASVCSVARGAGLTLAVAKRAGVDAYDLKELKKAGIR